MKTNKNILHESKLTHVSSSVLFFRAFLLRRPTVSGPTMLQLHQECSFSFERWVHLPWEVVIRALGYLQNQSRVLFSEVLLGKHSGAQYVLGYSTNLALGIANPRPQAGQAGKCELMAPCNDTKSGLWINECIFISFCFVIKFSHVLNSFAVKCWYTWCTVREESFYRRNYLYIVL